MPGFAHLIYGFAFGLLLQTATNSKFSVKHTMVFGVNNYCGPDIGAVIWYFSRGIGDDFSYWILFLFHNPYMFPITLGLPLSYLWVKLTELNMSVIEDKWKIVRKKEKALSLKQCFMLVTAGAYSHFFIDNLFDGGGRMGTYLWVINTGYWNDPYLDASVILPAILTAIFIILFIYLNKSNLEQHNRKQLRNSIVLLAGYTILYLIFLGIRLLLGVPALGEEADFGVIIFLFVFLFFPLFLCLCSIYW